ncbi:MAG: hypothetical protein MK165_09150 [Pirellulaceae bacterium]|jgi:hypothetical protein|nr:hypothetical protein [Pirellulaceae bacterium]
MKTVFRFKMMVLAGALIATLASAGSTTAAGRFARTLAAIEAAEEITAAPLPQPVYAVVYRSETEGGELTLCSDQPCVTYRHHGKSKCRRSCCDCPPPVQTSLMVKNPCSCCCCYYKIDVCVPACCEGEPCVVSHCCLLGGSVVYRWACGYRVKVVFKKCGNVVVHTFGL